MSGPRIPLLIFACLLLAACSNISENTDRDRLEEVVASGILRIVYASDEDEAEEEVLNITTAVIGSLTETITLRVDVSFPIYRIMRFANDTGEFTLFVENNQRVMQGDKLAHLSFENERMEIDRVDAQRALDQFNRDSAAEAQRLRTAVDNAYNALELACEATWVELALVHAQAELSYERFRISSGSTRDRLAQNLADLDNTLAGEYLLAPFDGIVHDINRTLPEYFNRLRANVLNISSEEFFVFNTVFWTSGRGGRPPGPRHAGIIGYGNILSVQSLDTGRGAPPRTTVPAAPPAITFDVKVLSDPWTAGYREQLSFWLVPTDPEGLMEALYSIDPYDPMYVLRNTHFVTDIEIVTVDHDVLLSNLAIRRQDLDRYVFVLEDGIITRRFITIGTSDGYYTHIITGLDPGTQVVLP